MTSEKRILNESLIAVSALHDCLAWRNNTGQAWQGTHYRAAPGQNLIVQPGMIVLMDARPIAFGLPGSADILGVLRGRAFGIEAKTQAGRQSEQQRKFEAAFRRAGGIYGIARSPAEAVAILTGGGGDGSG